ncbi:1-aminocyclopropane-1-carboxylate deaminase/D-cysteine desulfhydrase [Lacinutrix sp. 5H-3-7-4]|uniref:1-aminocyclopropane-1-carboxylate deaminase/D-cysteine desulfhydrase n=1 Tax=Lacinutrix sp. (strain 5H-3-7-4) TaxID=983544 RepID=UPI00020A3DFC|nr:pyridoxal-phosphate dependent enzyme [Lacinutrix sp. 5H-3-7-4]AEH01493.1 1-aminocyclopropane-1-carboxylate deaminase [Lacinutrix sp. 5H-3-7-4]
MIFDLENVLNKKIITKNALNVEVHLKREDTIHPIISGNKYRKLKYNLKEAKQQNKNTVVTFGGAYSNHIAAVAAAGKVYGFKTIGVIRGEEIKDKLERNATLKYAKSCGMTFKFISRLEFRNKNEFYFIENLKNEFGDFYNIPEGGTNALAIKGCEEILTQDDFKFNYVCTSVGTGGTVAGIINSTKPNQQVLGFSALKGDFLREDISKFAKQDNWKLITNYHFGGYAKINEELITFINTFKAINNIQLDPIYTGKMLFGIQDLIEKKYFPEGSKILAIHTGGLQGIQGMNERLKQKGLPIIK